METLESSTLTRIPSLEIWNCAREVKPTQRRMLKSWQAELVTAEKHGGAGAGWEALIVGSWRAPPGVGWCWGLGSCGYFPIAIRQPGQTFTW